MPALSGGGGGMTQSQTDALYPSKASIKTIRSGSVSLVLGDLTSKAVAFGSAMPDSNYELFFQPIGNLAVVLWSSSKTANGFTLNLSAAISGSVSYLAVQN